MSVNIRVPQISGSEFHTNGPATEKDFGDESFQAINCTGTDN